VRQSLDRVAAIGHPLLAGPRVAASLGFFRSPATTSTTPATRAPAPTHAGMVSRSSAVIERSPTLSTFSREVKVPPWMSTKAPMPSSTMPARR
jgi:hypothetical protein